MSLLGFVNGQMISPLPHIDYTALLPEFALIGGALALLLINAMSPRKVAQIVYTTVSVLTAGIALVCSIFLWNSVSKHGPFTTIAKAMNVDGFYVAFAILSCCILVVASLLADGYLQREGIDGPEYHALALMAASGAMFMASANDLIVIFLGLEIMSIPLYIMAGLDQRRSESGEAAMKYFVLGAFSSALFVYGIALTYGATGSTNLASIATYLSTNVVTSNTLLLAGLALLLVGFGFKIAAVPFHMWTPDVYQGAPTPATGFMAAIAKVGGFAALLRVFYSSFHTLAPDWQPLLWALALVSLLFGAFVGLVQRDIKRMLAYSSINHAGFILLGLQAATSNGISASLYYVFIYAFLVLGSFAVIAVVAGPGDRNHDIDSYKGLAKRNPILALAFAVLLLAQAGAPFTTGLLAKFRVVEAAAAAHSYALAVIAMLSAVIAAAFYLRVVFYMYGEPVAGSAGSDAGALQVAGVATSDVSVADPEPLGAGTSAVAVAERVKTLAVADAAAPLPRIDVPAGVEIGIAICVGFTVAMGIWPAPIFAFIHSATLLF